VKSLLVASMVAVSSATACQAGPPPVTAPAVVSVPAVEAGAPVATAAAASAAPPASSTTATAADDAGDCAGKCKGMGTQDLGMALQQRAGSARHCYNAALRVDPKLEGLLRVAVRIAPDGNVCSVAATESSVPADMAECVLGAFRGTAYPAPVGGCVDATVPMSFKAQAPPSGP